MAAEILTSVCNARIQGKDGLWELKISNGKFSSIEAQQGKIKPADGSVLDAEEYIVIPPFVDPHIHLDTTQTAGQPRWNQSGTLFEGIECWSERRKTLSHEDVKQRAWKTLKWHIANGIQYVRTHVDVCDPELVALKAMLEVKKEVAPWIELQIVAFPQEGMMSFENGEELMEKAIQLGCDCVGGIPHMEHVREYGVEAMHKTVALAKKYNKLVDVHCDEIDDEQSRFIEVLALAAMKAGIGERTTASHTTAMASYNHAYTQRLFRLLKMSKINFVSNPIVNIHLQGRHDTYPKRRGVTRVKELLDEGMNVCFGTDDLIDPWNPLSSKPLQIVHMGLHVCHMMGYEEINSSLRLVSSNGAKALNLKDYGIEVGKTANLLVLPADSGYDAIRRQVPVRYSVRAGKVISETKLAETTIQLEKPEAVDFKL